MYVPIHNHSDHSVLDGISKVEEIAKWARKIKAPACSLTDHGTVTGLMPFQDACEKEGIKSILGIEFYCNEHRDHEDNEVRRNNSHLCALVKDKIGFKNLSYLVYESNINGFYYRPRTNSELIFNNHEGLIITTACIQGIIGKEFISENGNRARAERLFKNFVDVFGEDFYAEIQFNELEQQHIVNREIIKLAKKFGVKLVLGLDSHYPKRKDSELQDIFLMIQQNRHEVEAEGFSTRYLYIKPEKVIREEVIKWGYNISEDQLQEALDSTLEIAEKCNFKWEFEKYHFPKFGKTLKSEEKTFIKLTRKGFNKLYKKGLIPERDIQKYKNRLEYELEVINKKKFAPYFLVLRDLIRNSEKLGAICGVGRGSACGSIVSWCLGITKLDPIKFGLLFERFLDLNKDDMPDIDVDFDSEHKDCVEKYIIEKYGADNVCKIVSLTTLGVKSILENLLRLLDIDETIRSDLYKVKLDSSIDCEDYETFIKSIEENEKYSELLEHPDAIRIFDYIKKLEGRISTTGTHAAGIIITPVPVYNLMPVQRPKKAKETGETLMMSTLTEGVVKKDISKLGMLKIDILGLTTLSIIRDTIELIKETKNIDLGDMLDVDLNDQNIYKKIRSGKTKGTFQFESDGIISLIKQVKPKSFNELVAINALFRPATLNSGQHLSYIHNKNNPTEIEGISNYHSDIKNILKDTHYILCYQEQVMNILHVIGGFSLPDANSARKLLVKKLAKDDDLEVMRKKFLKGAKKKGLSALEINDIWMVLKEFSKYSFNLSHSTSYCFIFYITMYLKTYYYDEYMSIVLSYNKNLKSKSSDIDTKFSKYVKILRKENSYRVLSPDINLSGKLCRPEGNKCIRSDFSIIKGIGSKAIEELVSKQPFYNMTNLLDGTISGRACNKRIICILAEAGVFDSLYPNRRGLVEFLKKFYLLKQTQRKKYIEDMYKNSYVNMRPYNKEELQELELKHFGFYLTEHPFEKHKNRIQKINKKYGSKIIFPSYSKKFPLNGIIAGIVSEISNTRKTKNMKSMRFVTISDDVASIKLVMFDRHISEYMKFFKIGKVVLFRFEYNEFYNSFMISESRSTYLPEVLGGKNNVINFT